jgi:RecA-family ATPase
LSIARNGSSKSNGKAGSSPFTMGGGDDFQSSAGAAKGNRHAELLTLVGSHIANGDGPLDILKLAYEWCDKCDPPHDRADAERVVNDLCSRDRKDAGGKTAEPIVFETITTEELAGGDYRLEYLIEDMLVAGQPCIIAGPKKALKTNIAIDLTLSLADGVPFLGTFDVARPTKVGLMSGESGSAVIQETARRIALGKLRPLGANFRNAFWCFQIPELSNKQHVKALRDFIESNQLEVVILDPCYLMMLGIADSAGNLFSVGGLLKEIAEIGQETGTTIILVHHTKKSVVDPFEPPELEDIAWSGFQEFARQWFLIGRRKKYNPDQKGDHELWLNVGGSAGHSGLWGIDIAEGVRSDPKGRRWDVNVMFASEARQQAAEAKQEQRQEAKKTKRELEQEADRNAAMDVLQSYPEGETTTILRELLGFNSEKMGRVLRQLIASGKVVTYAAVSLKRNANFSALRFPISKRA